MTRRTKEDMLITRNKILDAAELVFFEKGVAHTALADIAQRAGLTRGAIYWHFKHKINLFDAILERVRLPIDELKSIPKRARRNPVLRLRRVLVGYLLDITRDPQLNRVFSILFLKCEYTGEMGPILLRTRYFTIELLEQFHQILTSAVEKQQLPETLDTRRSALILHTFVCGFIRDMLMLPDIIDAEKHAMKLVDGCIDMLRHSRAMRKSRFV
ncbi:TetR family transcriptional regulator [Burkholderia lata]|uniref:TetR family transcriptional regulator n=1 Tax=Burkholderia lata (strain ATCC 17760 / DSM 23089 / LMG 22485 / NCIMB 9086 / R18194 / 383) TaxID=482957 RepID=A0A6P2RGR7_BURL3|nr:TetR family transcriptional regulator [Burkholderia lata]VWC35986.1 TetR family transcriptional regulator [Burkholderia lata]